MAYLLLDTLAVGACTDIQVGSAVECQGAARINIGCQQAHVGAGLQQHAVTGLQLRAAQLVGGGGTFALVGFAGDEEELFVPAFLLAGDALAAFGIQSELLSSLYLDTLGFAVDGAKA
ncbi:hypothetical protein D3C81_823040 [compost metagenome]